MLESSSPPPFFCFFVFPRMKIGKIICFIKLGRNVLCNESNRMTVMIILLLLLLIRLKWPFVFIPGFEKGRKIIIIIITKKEDEGKVVWVCCNVANFWILTIIIFFYVFKKKAKRVEIKIRAIIPWELYNYSYSKVP